MFISLPKRAHDLAGRRFGRLAALGPVEIRRYIGATHVIWRCSCDCGSSVNVSAGHLRSGNTTSCGCYRKEVSTSVNTKHGQCRKRAKIVTKEYRAWTHMIGRCHTPTDRAYARYGGRGITVCDEWRSSFQAFFDHVGKAPSSRHTIDRVDNSGGYMPGNVRWATYSEQNRNRRPRSEWVNFGKKRGPYKAQQDKRG